MCFMVMVGLMLLAAAGCGGDAVVSDGFGRGAVEEPAGVDETEEHGQVPEDEVIAGEAEEGARETAAVEEEREVAGSTEEALVEEGAEGAGGNGVGEADDCIMGVSGANVTAVDIVRAVSDAARDDDEVTRATPAVITADGVRSGPQGACP